jgi:galactose mutarotase-like enzyme
MFPNGPNEPGFPDPVLRPDDTYLQLTEYRFLAAP